MALATTAVFLLGLAAIPAVFSVTPSGTINFFDVSGSGASSTCTSTVWNGGTYMDGNQGFGGNLGSAQYIPIVANGEEICIQIIFVDQAASTSFTISDPGGYLSLVTGSNPFKTDGSGDANVFLIFSVSGLSGDCTTHPLKISPDISGGSGDAGQIHHYYGGAGACGGTPPSLPPPPSVPEFPFGLLGITAIALSALLLLRRKFVGVPNS